MRGWPLGDWGMFSSGGPGSWGVVFILGHLGFSLLFGRLVRPFWPGRMPVGWLLFGALLPDLMDKPVGHFILPWDNGRLIGHALVFAIALGVFAWVRSSRVWGAIALGVFFHQLQDGFWLDLNGWFWPFMGPFEHGVSSGIPHWIAVLTSSRLVWITEAMGFVFIVLFFVAPCWGWTKRWWEDEALVAEDVEVGDGEKAPIS